MQNYLLAGNNSICVVRAYILLVNGDDYNVRYVFLEMSEAIKTFEYVFADKVT